MVRVPFAVRSSRSGCLNSPRRLLAVAVAVAAIASPLSRSAEAQGRSWAIAVPGYTTTLPADVNNHGDVVGSAHNCSLESHVGFIYRHGVYTLISVPGAASTHLTDINERGVAIGYAWIPDESGRLVAHSFIVDDGLITPITGPATNHVIATSINARGDIIGVDVGVVPGQTFVRDARGQVAILQPPPDVRQIFGQAVTAAGRIVGNASVQTGAGTSWVGFTLERGTLTLLPQFSDVADVNARGDLLATEHEHFGLPQIYRGGGVVPLPHVSGGSLYGISNTWVVGARITPRHTTPGRVCFDAVGFMTKLPGGPR